MTKKDELVFWMLQSGIVAGKYVGEDDTSITIGRPLIFGFTKNPNTGEPVMTKSPPVHSVFLKDMEAIRFMKPDIVYTEDEVKPDIVKVYKQKSAEFYSPIAQATKADHDIILNSKEKK